MSRQRYQEIGAELAGKFETSQGQMFGKPCLKIQNKAFAAFFRDCMVFKLGREAIHREGEKYIGAENWDPSGKKRPMKDWWQVPPEYAADWSELAEAALKFVESQL